MQADITALRTTLSEIVSPRVSAPQVQLAPTELASSELMFALVVIVGPPGPETENEIDCLFNDIPELLNSSTEISAFVTWCSGHRLYADAPGEAPKMGCEWKVKVLA